MGIIIGMFGRSIATALKRAVYAPVNDNGTVLTVGFTHRWWKSISKISARPPWMKSPQAWQNDLG
jgi:hypothetical protein